MVAKITQVSNIQFYNKSSIYHIVSLPPRVSSPSKVFLKRDESKLTLELKEARVSPVSQISDRNLRTRLQRTQENRKELAAESLFSPQPPLCTICKGETQPRLHWMSGKPVFIEHLLCPGTVHSFAHLLSPNPGKVSNVIPLVQVAELEISTQSTWVQSCGLSTVFYYHHITVAFMLLALLLVK